MVILQPFFNDNYPEFWPNQFGIQINSEVLVMAKAPVQTVKQAKKSGAQDNRTPNPSCRIFQS